MCECASRSLSLPVPLSQVIGKGGENINKLTAESGCKIQLTQKDKHSLGRYQSCI
jgi:polyribonucleotide nucleotidyltransferase